MKTVKFYNKITGQWEPIAGISTIGGVSDYNDLSNKPDLSVYALKSELEALREELTNLINSQEPDSQYYTEYTIDNSVSTFSLRSVDNPINNGQYIPQFSGGYDYIKITLTDGNVTTNLNTSASEVEKIKIYYPEETTYIKFADTKVKDVEYINGVNITDVTSMFQNCSSLESANLTTLDSSKVSVDTTMFTGVNTDVQLQFNDEWSYTNRDMGLIKMVDVVMHHYREDGLYENSSIYLKSQYDENPVQYVIRQVDPEDERWRYEPFTLEYDTAYEIYFEDNGNTGETMNACFMGNMDIFFVGGSPNSFTDSRPEIGGNEEPEVEYITGFNLQGKEMISLDGPIGVCDTVYITPNETGRPMNFVVDFPDSNWGAISYTYHNDEGNWRIDFFLNGTYLEADSTVTIREVNSGITQDIRMVVDPKVSLFVHYKATDGDYENDHLRLSSDTETTMHYFVNELDDYGVLTTINIDPNVTYTAELDYNSGSIPLDGQIRISEDTHIWISDDSDEILYENPNSSGPDEPVTYVQLTLHYNRKDGNYSDWDLWYWCLDGGHNTDGSSHSFDNQDDFGVVAYLGIEEGCELGYIIRKNDWSDKNHSDNQSITMDGNKEIWVTQGQNGYHTERPNLDEVYPEIPGEGKLLDLVVHYERTNSDYDGYRMYTWGTSGDTHQDFEYDDSYGKTATFSFNDGSEVPNFGFSIYKEVEGSEWYNNIDAGDKKDIDPNSLHLIPNADGNVAHIYVKEGSNEIYYLNPNKEVGAYSTLTLHFNRQDGDYADWDVVVTNSGSEDGSRAFAYKDDFGVCAEFTVQTGNNVGYIIRKTDGSERNHPDDQYILIYEDTEIWVNEGQNGFNPIGPNGNRIPIEGVDEPDQPEEPDTPEEPSEPTKPYYIEYTLIDQEGSYSLNGGGNMVVLLRDYEMIDTEYTIILKDGSTTNDTNTLISDISSVRVYYDNTINSISFEYCDNLKEVLHMDIEPITLANLFSGCSNLETVNASNWDVSGKTCASEMFNGCESLITLDLSGWDISNFDNITRMFMGCKSLTSLNLSGWDTTKVEAATQLFQNCYALETLNISGWDTSNFSFYDMMLSGVPETVNFIYEGTNWTLTEEQTGFSGTFPWNQTAEE